jgi:hypothetical protein
MGVYALVESESDASVVAVIVVEHSQIAVLGGTATAERLASYAGDTDLLDDEELTDEGRLLAHAVRGLSYQPVIVRRVEAQVAFEAATSLAAGPAVTTPSIDVDLRVDLTWRYAGAVELEADLLVVPDLPRTPGVYRWTVSHGSHSRFYIGEAVDLRRRFASYRVLGPTQSTNRRMADRARRVLSAGGSIRVYVADPVRLAIGGRSVTVDLGDEFIRRIVENAALVDLVHKGGEIINGKGRGTLVDHDLLR